MLKIGLKLYENKKITKKKEKKIKCLNFQTKSYQKYYLICSTFPSDFNAR